MSTEEDTLSVNVSGDDSLKLKAAVFNQNSDFHDAATKHDPFLCDESIDNNVSSINSDASNIQGQATDTSTEIVEFKIICNKEKYDVSMPKDSSIEELKNKVHVLTGICQSMQKIAYKGATKDHQTLRELGISNGAKVMAIGCSLNDVISVTPTKEDLQAATHSSPESRESFSQQKLHKKVLEKYGKPDDVMPGVKGAKLPLPQTPLHGMYNKQGSKVRLTFKLEADQVWLATKERTEKIPMNSIKQVVSEALDGSDEYHLMGLQLGPTEASRYWIYWVPAQFIEAIKDAILGNWQLF